MPKEVVDKPDAVIDALRLLKNVSQWDCVACLYLTFAFRSSRIWPVKDWRVFLLSSGSDSSYHQLMPRKPASDCVRTNVKLVELDPRSEKPIDTITTAIHIPRSTWSLLRAVAFRRAQDQGSRVSVSRLVSELVERHRAELEREIR